MEDDFFSGGGFGGMAEGFNIAAEAQAKEKAQQYQLQAKSLAIQGRAQEANAAFQKAQIELRKAELAQQKYLTERAQQLQASGTLAQLRGPGNAAQFIDFSRRARSFGTYSPALAQIAAGVMPTGSFAPGASGNPQSLTERMSGNLGGPTEDQIAQRDRNDRALAQAISSQTGQLARGSLELLSPYERAYLGSNSEAGGFDWDTVVDSYKRAGIHQGGGR